MEKLIAVILRVGSVAGRQYPADQANKPLFWRFLEASIYDFVAELAATEDCIVPITESVAIQLRNLLQIDHTRLLYALQTQGFNQVLRLINSILKKPLATEKHVLGSMLTPLFMLLSTTVSALIYCTNVCTKTMGQESHD